MLLPNLLFSQIDTGGKSFIFAKKLYDDKMYDVAAEQFHQFAEQNPNDPKAAEALYLAGLSYFNIEEYQKAKKEFLYLILQFPNGKDLDQAQYKIAECFQALGDLSASANAYHQVYVFYAKSPLAEQALFTGAQMFFNDKQYDKAIEILYEFLEVYPRSKLQNDAQLLIAESFIADENYDQAIISLDKVLATTEIGRANAKALLMKATLSYRSHYLHQAENDYLKLVEKYATGRFANDKEIIMIMNDAYYYLGEIFRLKGMYEKSNEYLYKISNYQTDPKILFLIGKNLYSAALYSNATDMFQKVISIPDSTLLIHAYMNLGDSYFALKDFGDAANAYKQAVNLCEKNQGYSDSDIEICNLIDIKLAETYINLDQANIAISFLKKYSSLNKGEKNIDAIDYKIANLYQTKVGDYERAIRSYFDFMDAHPQSKLIDEAQLGLATCYEQMGNYAQALIEYQNLINNYPASKYYFNAKSRIGYLNNYSQAENSAIKNLSGVVQQLAENRTNTTALYKLGLTYFKELKDYQAVIALFDKILNFESKEGIPVDELLYYLGRSYQLLAEKANINNQNADAQIDSAGTYYARLLNEFPDSDWADDAAFHQIELTRITYAKNEPNSFLQMRDALASFTNKYVTSPYLDQVNFDLGLLQLNQGIDSSADSLNVYNCFQKVIDFPNSSIIPEAIYYQSTLLIQTENLSLAQDRLNYFVNNYPNSSKTCEAYFQLAKLSELKLDFFKASEYLKQIITKYYYSDLADIAKLNIGYYLTKQENYVQALTHYMDIYDEYETNISTLQEENFENQSNILQDVIFNIANILKTINQRDEAIQFYQKYLLKYPEGKFKDQVLFSLGILFSTSKNEEQTKAMDYFQQLENSGSSNGLVSKSFVNLGDILFNQEKYEEARQYYSKALNGQLSDEDRAYISAQEIICLYKVGQIVLADDKYNIYKKQFKDEKSRQGEIQLEKGDYFLREKIFDQAEKIFKQVRSDFKNSSEGVKADYLLGKLYFILNKDEDALEILTDLIKKQAGNKILAEVYITLGNFYYLQAKQIENALLAYKNAIEQKDISEQNLKIGMHNLIKCYSDLQLWDKAIALSREFLNRFPLSDDAFEKKIQIGYFYYRLNEYDYAVQLFRKILPEADVDNEPRIQFWIGECYFGSGQFQQAISEYLKIVYFSKPSKLLSQYKVTAQYQAAISYIKLGKPENARQLLRRIITEQGAESLFGKSAKEKLEEINQTSNEYKEGNL